MGKGLPHRSYKTRGVWGPKIVVKLNAAILSKLGGANYFSPGPFPPKQNIVKKKLRENVRSAESVTSFKNFYNNYKPYSVILFYPTIYYQFYLVYNLDISRGPLE